jgi:hypothetical protein
VSHQNHQNATGGTPKAAQTSGSNKAVAGKFKIVRTPSDCRLTPEPEATELRELIRTLQKKEVQPKREDILPPAA